MLLYTEIGYNVNGGIEKMICYDQLWATMKEKGISKYALIKQYHISPGQLTRLKRNESVSTHTIDMFCEILQCGVNDVMEHIPTAKADEFPDLSAPPNISEKK